jgi:hypothetical protein
MKSEMIAPPHMLIDGDYTGGLLHGGVIEKIFERVVRW